MELVLIITHGRRVKAADAGRLIDKLTVEVLMRNVIQDLWHMTPTPAFLMGDYCRAFLSTVRS